MKNFFQTVWCMLTHKAHIAKKGEGDYNQVKCDKCKVWWTEFRL